MIEVPQAHLIFGKKDDVPGMAVRDPALGPQLGHPVVDCLQVVDVQLLFHPLHQGVHNEAAGDGIVRRPVVLEIRQAQGVGYDVQLELVEVGQHILAQNQGVRGGQIVGKALTAAFCPDKAGIKVRIVGNKHPIPHKFQEFGQNLLNGGGAFEHLVGDAGELHNLFFQWSVGIHKGLEPVQLFPVFHNHGADFNDPVIGGAESGSLQIKGHIFLPEGNVLAAVDHNPVVHVVDVVALTAV